MENGTSKLAEALSGAQKDFTPVPKNKIARVKTKQGYEYTYKYADLADVLKMALPILAKHGIAFSQPLRRVEGKTYVTTELEHVSGAKKTSDGIAIPDGLTPQEFGSYFTYWRRYDGCGMLGIAPDEDEDGAIASKRKTKSDDKDTQQHNDAVEHSTLRCEGDKCGKAILPYVHPSEGKKELAQVLNEGRQRFGKDLCGGCQIKMAKNGTPVHSDVAVEIVEIGQDEYAVRGIVTGIFPGDPFAIKLGDQVLQAWHKNTIVPHVKEAKGKRIDVECEKRKGFYCIEKIHAIGSQKFVDNKPVTELEAATTV